jgi:hypothetical protein
MFVAVQPPDDVLDHLDDFLDARRDDRRTFRFGQRCSNEPTCT